MMTMVNRVRQFLSVLRVLLEMEKWASFHEVSNDDQF